MRRPSPPSEVEAASGTTRSCANVLYHDWEAGTYDEKWSISYDERCIDLRPGPVRARRRTGRLAVPAGAGDRLRHRLLPAQPHAGRAWPARGSVTDISPGMVEVALRNAESLGLRRRRAGRRRRDDPVRGRDVRPGRRARGAAPHPGRRAGAARGAAGAQAGRPVRVRRRADPVRRRRRAPAVPADLVGRDPGDPAAALRRLAPAAARSWTSRPGRPRWRRSSTCTRSPRPSCAGWPIAAGAVDVAVRDRGADRGLVRLAGAHVRGRGAAGEAGLGLGHVRLPRAGSGCPRWTAGWPGWCPPGCSTTRW